MGEKMCCEDRAACLIGSLDAWLFRNLGLGIGSKPGQKGATGHISTFAEAAVDKSNMGILPSCYCNGDHYQPKEQHRSHIFLLRCKCISR